jgi:hypothetical protein
MKKKLESKKVLVTKTRRVVRRKYRRKARVEALAGITLSRLKGNLICQIATNEGRMTMAARNLDDVLRFVRNNVERLPLAA